MVKRKWFINFLSIFLINPVFTAALVSAVLFYTGTVKLKDRNQFKCLFPMENITVVTGNLASSPVRSSKNQEIYSADFNVEEVCTFSGSFSQSSGQIKILLPASSVEALLPGKVYSKNKRKSPADSEVFETGKKLKLQVEYLQPETNLFNVKKILPLKEDVHFLNNEKKRHLSIKTKILNFRALCRLNFKRLLSGWGEAGGLLLALLTGSREYADQFLQDAFRDAGLSHILALSGMHLSLFGGLAFFIGNKVTRRSTADFLELAAIIFFVWFAGPGPSLLRALISSIITFTNSALRMRRFKGITVLSATFLLHLMIVPSHLKSAAFMLSYGALAGIMTVGQLIKYFISKRLFPKLSSSLSESAGAQIFTAPVTISLFGRLMPVGIISSVIVSPLVIFFLYAGLLGTVLCLMMPFLQGLFNDIMNTIYLIIKKIVLFFAQVPPIDFGEP